MIHLWLSTQYGAGGGGPPATFHIELETSSFDVLLESGDYVLQE